MWSGSRTVGGSQLGDTGTELRIYIYIYIWGYYFQPCNLYEIKFPTKNIAELFRCYEQCNLCQIVQFTSETFPWVGYFEEFFQIKFCWQGKHTRVNGMNGIDGRGLSILDTRLILRQKASGVISQVLFIRHTTTIHEATCNKYVFSSYFIVCIRFV
jgi:hypothetical protein